MIDSLVAFFLEKVTEKGVTASRHQRHRIMYLVIWEGQTENANLSAKWYLRIDTMYLRSEHIWHAYMLTRYMPPCS